MCLLSRPCCYCYRFLPFVIHESGSRKTIYWSMIMTEYINNILVHCRKIYDLVEPTLETGRITRCSVLFRSQCIWILYVPTTYVYCVYPATWKSSSQLPNCLKKGRNNRRSHRFLMVFLMKSAIILLPFLTVAQHEASTSKNIS